MTRTNTIIFGLGFILIIIISIFLQAAAWQTSIENYVNGKLKQNSSWQVSIPVLEGNLLSTIRGPGITLTHHNGTKIIFGEFSVRINYVRTLVDHPTLALLQVNDIQVYPVTGGEKKSINNIDIDNDFNFIIEEINIGGFVEIPIREKLYSIACALDGQLNINKKKKEFIINELSTVLNDTLGFLLIRNTTINVYANKVEVNSMNGVFNGLPFGGDIYYDWSIAPELSGDIHIERYDFPQELLEHLPLKPKFSSLESFLHFESDLQYLQGDFTLKNPLGLLMKGEISLTRHPNYITLNQLNLESEASTLSLTGMYEYNGRISGNILLSQFDLSKWLVDQQETNVNGSIILDGTVLSTKQLIDMGVTLEVNETKLYGDHDISISGSFFYHDDHFTFDTPLSFAVGPSAVVLNGFVDLKKEEIDLDLKLQEASVFLINNFWSDSLSSGYATGDLVIKGSLKNPSIKAELDCKNLGYQGAFFEQITLYTNWLPEAAEENGFFRAKIGKGTWKKYVFENGTIDVGFSRTGINIQSADFKQGENYLQISGFITPDSTLILDRMQIVFEDHYFINVRPFSVRYFGDDRIKVNPFEIHVDDGVIVGEMDIADKIRGEFHVSNVSADIVKLFTNDTRYHISGMGFGDISIKDVDNDLELKLGLTIKNGSVTHQPFSKLVLNGSYHQSLLEVEEISMVHENKHIISISGSIPLGKVKMGVREFNFNVLINELHMSSLTQFIQPNRHLDGIISGSYHLEGNTEKTVFNFDLEIKNAIWDRLSFGTVTSEGLYDSKRLYFNRYKSVKNGSVLEGAAYLPIDFNLASDNFGSYFANDSMWVDVHGQTSNMEFLSAYLSDVDSINGNIDIALNITGPPGRLIRKGHLSCTGTTIYSVYLDHPIYNVQGHAELRNNQFELVSLSGSLVKKSSDSRQNVIVTGGMNLSQFFNPNYNLNITGSELQFRTLLGDIEGTVNIDLNIEGQDTIVLSGIIEPVDAVMYQEFVASNRIESIDDKNDKIVNYKLTFPLSGDFALRNSQIDARLTGTLSMTKLGNRPADFGGELYTREGKFYYYGNVFTISDGYMLFDKKGFNPDLDIAAHTKISQEQIYIHLVGPLDDPQLDLESSSGFSYSDIIELLMLGSRFEDQEISAQGFGNRALNIFGAYFEQQLEKNFLSMTGLDKAGIVDELRISGAASLFDRNINQEFSINAVRQIAENLSLNYSFQRSFSLSNPVNNRVGVELRLNPYVSLVGNVDETGNMHVKYRLRYAY